MSIHKKMMHLPFASLIMLNSFYELFYSRQFLLLHDENRTNLRRELGCSDNEHQSLDECIDMLIIS